MVVESDFPFVVGVDVVGGALFDAQVAVGAFVRIHFVEERVDIAADELDGHDPGDYAVPDSVAFDIRDVVRDFVDEYVEEFVVHHKYLLDQIVVKAEMDVVGHQEMVFVLDDSLAALQLAPDE